MLMVPPLRVSQGGYLCVAEPNSGQFLKKEFIKRILDNYRIDRIAREGDLGLGSHDH